MSRQYCKCGGDLTKVPTKSRRHKSGKKYYFKYTLRCVECKKIYLDENSKTYFVAQQPLHQNVVKRKKTLKKKQSVDNGMDYFGEIINLRRRVDTLESLLEENNLFDKPF